MNEDKKPKKVKHRPNQRGVGMRTLNEHDADSYDEYIQPKGRESFYIPDDDVYIDNETEKKYLRD